MNIRLSAARKTIIAVLALICVFFLTLGVVSLCSDGSQSISASAETTDYTSVSSDNISTYITDSEGTYTFTAGSYKLTSDITVSNAVTISSGTTVNLDLNGYTLTVSGYTTVTDTYTLANSEQTHYVAIVNYGTLNIADSVGTGSITYGNNETTQTTIYNNGNNSAAATLNISGGTVKGYNTIINNEYSTANISGGTVDSTHYAVWTAGTLNISGDAKITAKGSADETWYYGVRAVYSASVTVNDSAYISGVGEGETSYGAGLVYFGKKDANTTVTVTVNGGTIIGSAKSNESYGMSGNGSYSSSKITINGGTITCDSGVGIYHPESGDLVITGGTVSGKYAGVQMCAGTLSVTGGTITATATADEIESSNENTSKKSGDGYIADGAAISIINRNGYGISQSSNTTSSFNSNSVTISGGTFTSESGAEAVQAYNYDSGASTNKLTALETQTSDSQTIIAVTGGTFSSGLTGDYSKYVAADGLTTEQNADGTYGVTVDETADGYSGYGSKEVWLITSSGISGFSSVSEALKDSSIYDSSSTRYTVSAVSIWLNDNVTENITIPKGLSVTLDLRGHKIENQVTSTTNGETTTYSSSHTITVKAGATLTINDSVGGGIVDNTFHACAAIYSETTTATVVLNGGSYTRSKEASTSMDDNGSNSYYILLNHGTMIINEGVTVGSYSKNSDGTDNTSDALGKYSSLIENGWQNGAQNADKTNSYLIINGGTFIGGLNTVKNDEYGVLTINNGTFTNTYQYVLLNWNVATINDGTFVVSGTNTSVICVGADSEITVGSMTINGGSFTGEESVIVAYTKSEGYTDGTDVTIVDGKFTGALSSDIESYTIIGGTYDSTAKASIEKLISSGVVNANIDLVSDSSGNYTAYTYDVLLTVTANGSATETYLTDGGTEVTDSEDKYSNALEYALAQITDTGVEYTITLGKNYTLTSAWTIGSGYTVTLDLNGYTVTINNGTTAVGGYYYYIVNNGTLTITDSVSGGGLVFGTQRGIYNCGTFTLESGTLTGGNRGVHNDANGTVTINGGAITGASERAIGNMGTLTINDGIIVGSTYGVISFGIVYVNGGTIYGASIALQSSDSSGKTELYITDGTIGTYGDNASIDCIINDYGKAVISGGTITGSSSAIRNGYNGNGGTVNITGGTITGDEKAVLTYGGTVDITGGTIKGNETAVFTYGGTINISGNAKITGTGNGLQGTSESYSYTYGIKIYKGATVTINDDAIITAISNKNNFVYGIGIAIYGYSEEIYSTLNVRGGTINADSYAISSNGSESATIIESNNSTVTYCPGYVKIYIYGGIITSNESVSMYLPAYYGETNIYGGTFTGYTGGVQVCAGSAVITGGTFIVTADYYTLINNSNYITNKMGDGYVADGAAVSILNRNGYGNYSESSTSVSSVVITGGSFTSISGTDAIQSYYFKASTTGSGDEKKANNTITVLSDSQTMVAVTGGTFSTDLSTGTYSSYLVADGLTTKQNADGTYGITVDTSYTEKTYVAYYNGTGYETLQAAITAAASDSSAYIIMQRNVTEDITISSGKKITLDLNGYTITNSSSHTITVESGATLTITGDGTVDNVSHECAALLNEGTVYLHGGTYTRSKEAGKSTSDNGGNSYYVILNRGTMVIGSETDETLNNVTVQTVDSEGNLTGMYSSLIENGWQDGSYNTNKTPANLTINGGTFQGGLNTVKNDDYGVLIINNGIFVNDSQHAVKTSNTATINGGEFTSSGSYAVYVNKTSTGYDEGILTINGGTFTGSEYAVWATDGATLEINNGTFNGGLSIHENSNVKINGGEFNGIIYALYTAKSNVAVTGGKFAGGKTNVIYIMNTGTVTFGETNDNNSAIIVDGTGVKHAVYVYSNAKNVTILSGTYIGDIYSNSTTITFISGGIYSEMPDSTYFATDYYAYKQTDGTYLVDTGTPVEIPAAAAGSYVYGTTGYESVYNTSEYEIATKSGTDVGVQTITLQLVSGSNYVWADGTTGYQYVYIYITNATIDLTVTDYSGTYDGTAHTGNVTVNDESGATVLYGTAADSINDNTAPTYNDAGTYKVYYQVSANNYTTVTGYFTVTINAGTITVTEPTTTYTYGSVGEIDGVTASVTTADITYSTSLNGEYGSIPTFTDAGTYTVYYKVEAANYNTVIGSFTVIIAKATYDMSGVSMANKTVTYDGTAYSITITGKLPSGVTVSYTGGGTAAGTYTVTATFTGDSANYEAIASMSATLTINKKSVTEPTKDDTTYTYSGNAQTYGIKTNSDYTITNATHTDAGTYTVTVSLNDKSNYVWANGGTADKTFTFVINKGMVGIPAKDTATYTFTGSAQTYGVTSNAFYTVSGGVQTSAGTYTVTISLNDTANYTWSDGTTAPITYSWTIGAKLYTVTAPAANNTVYVYNGSEQTYELATSTLYTISGNVQTNAGTYVVTVTLNDTANYTWTDGTTAALTYTFTVNAATMTITAAGYSGNYDGNAHSGSVTVKENIRYTVNYGTTSGTYTTTTAPAYTDAGTYVVYYEVKADNYNSVYGSYTITITETTVAVDKNNTVSGSVTSDSGFVKDDVTIEMNVVESSNYSTTVSAITSAVVDAVSEVKSAEVVTVYEITLTSNGNEITVSEATDGGSIKVSVAIPTALAGQSFYIAHIHNGEVIDVLTDGDYEVANGYVTFEVEHLSQFAFVAATDADSGLSQGEIITLCVLVGGTIAIIILLAVVLSCLNRSGKSKRRWRY